MIFSINNDEYLNDELSINMMLFRVGGNDGIKHCKYLIISRYGNFLTSAVK